MKKLAIILAAISLPLAVSASDWAPAGDNIRTRWASEVSPENSHPEYPRPQMERADWMSLNGLWNYAVTAAEEAMGEAEGKILVPFPIESSLSGVGRTITEDQALWYSREFTVPRDWKGGKVILNFDAVDWSCEVFVNGKEAGSHTGGYSAFSFDITKFLKGGGAQTLLVKVMDATENDFQPHGKQVKNPHSIWYTSVTGIWQSVWIEGVSKMAYVADYKVSSDLNENTISITPEIMGSKVDEIVVDLGKGSDVRVKTVKVGETAVFKLTNPQYWTPDNPSLYDIQITLKKSGKIIDRVKGYTAMRSISTKKDSRGNLRMALNGEPLFQYGPLDQGWWPDGLYTAPTDEALRYDIEQTKALGFNMIRKHVKVEPARWYYWCDKLGILVWQDMPSVATAHKNVWSQKVKNAAGENDFDLGTDYPLSKESKDNFRKEWKEIMTQLDKFQCIVVWVPFNEAWGQFDTRDIVDFTRSVDGTRLINAASGGNWVSGQVGDLLDSHYYPKPQMRIWDRKMVNVLGEYGGIGLPLEGHLWQKDKNWGYVQYKDGNEVTDAYVRYAEMLIPVVKDGCSAAVYTQTTDVEGEVNGLMTYDRAILKPDMKRISEANKKVIDSMK